jgi:hypothetical protein
VGIGAHARKIVSKWKISRLEHSLLDHLGKAGSEWKDCSRNEHRFADAVRDISFKSDPCWFFHKKAQMFQLGRSLDFLLRVGTHVLETLENLQVTEKVKVTETVKPQRICLSTFHCKSGLKDISASTLPIT